MLHVEDDAQFSVVPGCSNQSDGDRIVIQHSVKNQKPFYNVRDVKHGVEPGHKHAGFEQT